jgi:microcystin-dependent protein
MTSTPTTRNRLNRQGQGDNDGSWGTVLNTTVLDLIDESLDGITTITVTGNVTLDTSNYATDQSRKRLLKLIAPGSGTSPSSSIFIPNVEKCYFIHNLSNAPQQIGTTGGIKTTVQSPSLTFVYCDGVDTFTPTTQLTATIGAIVDFAGSAPPAGWLLCGGQAVSRTTYTALFQVIGTTYGAGNGSTTFNLPDLRSRVPYGRDAMGGVGSGRINNYFASANTLGAGGGNQEPHQHTHTVSISDPSHVHGLTQGAHSHTLSDPGHTHTVSDPTHNHGVSDPTHSHPFTDNFFTSGNGAAAGGVWGPSTVGGQTAAAYTGVSVLSAATGITIQARTTGASIVANTIPISANAAQTGISASASYTFAGGSGNLPPGIILNKMIYAGA